MEKINWTKEVRSGLPLGQVPFEKRTQAVCLAAVKASVKNLGYVPAKRRTPDVLAAAVLNGPLSKKTMREAGFVRDVSVIHKGQAPRRGEVPLVVKGETFWSEDQLEPVLSVTAWAKEGRKLKKGAEPFGQRSASVGSGSKHVTYNVFRQSDTEGIKKKTTVPAEKVDLLAAIFAVNRAAKRRRDAAKAMYEQRKHGFAGHQKDRKNDLYRLKDKGIAAAFRAGRLAVDSIHGGLVLYVGEGYVFHSPMIPKELRDKFPQEEASGDTIFIDSKPKESQEVRIKDAEYTIAETEDCLGSFVRIANPSMAGSRGGR